MKTLKIELASVGLLTYCAFIFSFIYLWPTNYFVVAAVMVAFMIGWWVYCSILESQ